jgi:hypothetical protein
MASGQNSKWHVHNNRDGMVTWVWGCYCGRRSAVHRSDGRARSQAHLSLLWYAVRLWNGSRSRRRKTMDEQEFELRQTELILREREVIAREREVSAKEREPHPSRWTNPLIISLLVGALALGGNIWTNISNNKASAEAEHFRAQSNLVLSVIKTNGNDEDACKNLNFFVNIGWLDDPKSAIHGVCGTKGGVPTLPATSGAVDNGGYGSGGFGAGGYGGLPWFGTATNLTVRVEDADSHQPIADAKVNLEQWQPPSRLLQPNPILGQPQGTTENKVVQSTTTGATGDATLNFVSSIDSLVASKDGYESVTKPASQLGALPLAGGTATIDLHRVPTPKPKH